MSAPFGIEFHAPVESLEVLQDLGQSRYVVGAPTPHPMFETYVVQATQRTGVVWVKGNSHTFFNDAYGYAVRSALDEVCAQLSRRYGQGRVNDLLAHGSIWNEPRDWIMSLAQHERMCSVTWERPYVRLPEDLSSVFLGVVGVSQADAFITLEYSSLRMSEAEADIHEQLSELL